jgi:hypothetical protein
MNEIYHCTASVSFIYISGYDVHERLVIRLQYSLKDHTYVVIDSWDHQSIIDEIQAVMSRLSVNVKFSFNIVGISQLKISLETETLASVDVTYQAEEIEQFYSDCYSKILVCIEQRDQYRGQALVLTEYGVIVARIVNAVKFISCLSIGGK